VSALLENALESSPPRRQDDDAAGGDQLTVKGMFSMLSGNLCTGTFIHLS
jgi:hypothetical protein